MPELHPEARRATDKVHAVGKRVADDRSRPIYHVMPESMWCNDPNGPLYHNGWYHLFYQLDPDDPKGYVKYWGHARSRDMVRWEHQPVALWPSTELEEAGVWSGCAAVTASGVPSALYTSVRDEPEAGVYAEQWLAVSDDEMAAWHKHPANPVMSEALHGETKVYDWRDPFIFQHDGETYCVTGGNLTGGKGRAVIPLYRATCKDLTAWAYLGNMWENPDASVSNHECPNFFQLDGPEGPRWVLCVSPHDEVLWYTGTFDPSVPRFEPEMSGTVGRGKAYAPNTLFAPDGRLIMFDWITECRDERDWNGCITIPRLLSLGDDGGLVQEPLPELAALRGERTTAGPAALSGSPLRFPLGDDAAEISLELELGGADGFRAAMENSAGQAVVEIAWDGRTLSIGDASAPCDAELASTFRVYLDRSVLEVFAGRERFAVNVEALGPDATLALTANGSATLSRLDVWIMESIWNA